jgi:hypothetical protein
MIFKQFTSPNGAQADYHVLKKVELVAPFTTAQLNVQSFSNEASYLAGSSLIWNSPIDIDVVELSSFTISAVEQWLTANSNSPFFGGEILVDQSTSLETARGRTWARIKQARTTAELGDFEFNGGLYQADKERIIGATTLAILAQSVGADYNEVWTLSDNSTVEFNAAQVISLGIALGKHVSSVFAIGRELRQAITEAQTIEELDAITWPT